MEVLSSWPTAVIAGLLVVFIAYRVQQRRKARSHPLVVRASYCLPILGNMLDFLPHTMLTSAREYPKKYGDFAEFYLMGTRGVLVTNAAIAKEVMLRCPKKLRRLKLFDYSISVGGFESGLFHSNGQKWNKIRRLTAPSFSHQNTIRKFPSVAHEIKEWIARIHQADCRVNMLKDSMTLTIRVITRVAFGLEIDDPLVAYFLSSDYTTDMYDFLGFSAMHSKSPLPQWLWRLSPLYKYEQKAVAGNARFSRHCQAILDYKRTLLQQSQAQPASMIDHLIAVGSHESEALGDDEIVANVKTFYIAGAETTSISITWACYHLCLHPESVRRIRQEVAEQGLFHGAERCAEVAAEMLDAQSVQRLSYTTAVVKEALRLGSPAFMLGFQPDDGVGDVELSNGVVIGQEDMVWINFDGLMSRGDVFADEARFDPERWLPGAEGLERREEHWMPFGYGPRICPGMLLAMLEATLAVAMLAHEFDMVLDCPAEEVRRLLVFAATANKMPIRFSPRK